MPTNRQEEKAPARLPGEGAGVGVGAFLEGIWKLAVEPNGCAATPISLEYPLSNNLWKCFPERIVIFQNHVSACMMCTGFAFFFWQPAGEQPDYLERALGPPTRKAASLG